VKLQSVGVLLPLMRDKIIFRADISARNLIELLLWRNYLMVAHIWT
jgi:hypothetical protein